MRAPARSLCLLAALLWGTGLCLAQVPVITSINPTSAVAGSPGFTLAVVGQNFSTLSRVLWNGSALANCAFDAKANTLSCPVPTALVASPGTASIQVVNQVAGYPSQYSTTVTFTIIAVPSISAISPNAVTAGCTGVVLTILGNWFLSSPDGGSMVQWSGPTARGQLLPPTFISSTELRLAIPDSFLALAGVAALRVVNPGGIASNSVDFVINPPPVIQTIDPSGATAGGADFTLTVTGSGFMPASPTLGSVVQWTSPSGATQDLATLFVSPSQLRAQVPSGLIATAGTARAAVVNPPCGVRSNWVAFEIVARLAITTTSLPNGTVGSAYSARLAAAGGRTRYTWAVTVGSLPAGLLLNSSTGDITGTPTTARTYDFTAQVTDADKTTAARAFTVTIGAALAITTASPLATGMVGVAYSQPLAATGGTTPYSWSISADALPPGLSISTSTGAITGTPTAPGTFSFTAQVTDTKALTLRINPAALLIITASPLPGGTVGVSYSQKLLAFGGVQPYTWSVSVGSLPPGLSLLGSTGDVTGTPTAAGTYNFTAQVTDSARNAVAKPFTLTIAQMQVPAVSFAGLSNTVQPGDQPRLQLNLAAGAPVAISGRLTLSFTADAVTSTERNASLQFATGGLTADFTIPAGGRQAQFGTAQEAGIQAGNVAGTITVTASLQAGGVDVTPSPAPTSFTRINRAAPAITTSVRVTRTATGLEVEIIGYATPRQVTTATFRFAATGADLTTPEISVNVDSAFATWYRNTASGDFGSGFRYVQPFTVTGETTAVNAVRVTLTNASGNSQEASASF